MIRLNIYLNSSIVFSFFVIERPPCCIHPGDTPVSASIVFIRSMVCFRSSDSLTEVAIVFIIAAECHVVPLVSLVEINDLRIEILFLVINIPLND